MLTLADDIFNQVAADSVAGATQEASIYKTYIQGNQQERRSTHTEHPGIGAVSHGLSLDTFSFLYHTINGG